MNANAEVGAQAAADKLMLKSQIDSLSAEVETLKVEQAKARDLQRLRDEHLAKMNEREKSLQTHLHETIETLHGK
jgi:hypothetical protein